MMIALRPDDHVNCLSPLENFLALGLRDAAGDGDLDAAAPGARALLQKPQLAHLGEDLLGGFFPDMTGI